MASRRVDTARLRGRSTAVALECAAVAAIGATFGLVVAGRLAEETTTAGVRLLLVCLVGSALADTLGRYLWAGVVDRAAGALRSDLLDAVLGQPLDVLSEQASGEVLDRIDDDTHEVSTLLRQQVWMVVRMAFALVPMWIVAGLTWWPASLLFPLFAAATWLVMRPLLAPIAARKVEEEAAWTDHAAVFEEGVAGRDDVRTSLGQPFLGQRLARLSANVHERFLVVLRLECRLMLRTGLTLHLLLITVVAAGVALASSERMSVAQLVTIFLVTSGYVGLMARVAEQLPDVQAGLGAVVRLRSLMASPIEPSGGAMVAAGHLDLEFRRLDFSYAQGTFGLRDVSMTVPAGSTLALVGRTGSGKSTLASLVSRAVEPPSGAVFLGGVDVTDLDLTDLRRAVGVVTQRTEILAGTVAQNITLFADVPRARVEDVVDALGLREWAQGMPDGLDTLLGPGGLALSAGEEQLLAFARILVRDVQVVVLDEATARMDPVTEARVVRASQRLLADRTGIIVAHRLSTIERADLVAVMEGGRVAQFGERGALLEAPGHFRTLSAAAASDAEPRGPVSTQPVPEEPATPPDSPRPASSDDVAGSRRLGSVPVRRAVQDGPSLLGGVRRALLVRPAWGLISVAAFLVFSVTGSIGGMTGWAWGHTVEALRDGRTSSAIVWGTVVAVLVILGPLALTFAVSRYPRWWIEVSLRVRMSVLRGQTDQRRQEPTPPGEVVARAMDSDRFVRYADRWVDFVNGLIIVAITAVLGGSLVAGLVLLAIMVGSALAAAVGRPFAGRSATQASTTRARFGRALVSTFDAGRTVKLAGRVPQVRAHLARVDAGRVEAAVREHRIQAILDGVPTTMVQLGVVAAWVGVLRGSWGLATALLVVNAANNFDWFGRVAGAVVTEAPGTRSWQRATTDLAGGGDLVTLPAGLDLVTGQAPEVPQVPREHLERLDLEGFTAVHDDGTRGAVSIDLTLHRGELVMLLGRVGSGKSSLLAALAGLVHHEGGLRWNGRDVDDPETFLRPGQVAYVAQSPRVLSGSFADNVLLGFERAFDSPIDAARLGPDVREAGGRDSLVGHRGVRLSGGQVQRLALARALATDAELLLADDVSSALDARTELELWGALRDRGLTVVGATSKRAALALADRVVVLVDGEVAEAGPWSVLEAQWGHLSG